MSGFVSNFRANNPLYMQLIPNRRLSEVAQEMQPSSSRPSHRGHKRSSSSGTPIVTNSSHSRSGINFNDDMSANYRMQQLLQSNDGNRNQVINDSINAQLEENFNGEDFNAYLVLEPKLQPIQPEMSDEDSVAIFNEHRKVSKEYLKMQMEVTLLLERKRELERAENRHISNAFEDYWQLKSEKDSLHQLHDNLTKQNNLIKRNDN